MNIKHPCICFSLQCLLTMFCSLSCKSHVLLFLNLFINHLLSDAIINGIIQSISFSDCFGQAYKYNCSCLLISYSDALINSFIRSNHFLWMLRITYIQYRIICEYTQFQFFLFNVVAFYFQLFLIALARTNATSMNRIDGESRQFSSLSITLTVYFLLFLLFF